MSMVFGVIFQRVLDEAKGEAKKKETSPYWVVCSVCGRRVVKKELINKGCYVCGWQGTEEELEQFESKASSKEGGMSSHPTKGSPGSYRTNCPQCGRRVIREELERRGCFICAYKAEMD